jgi:predicted DNA binding protein
MRFLDARVRIQHPCPFCEFSKKFPEMEMSSWCNVENEVMQVVALDEEQLKEIVSYAKENFDARQVAGDRNSALLATNSCMCNMYDSVSSIADKYESWSVPPTIYFGGWETHRIISHNKGDLKRFANNVKKMGKIEIISLREREQLDMLNTLGVVPIHFFGGLTNRQLRAIVSAYENGLFEVPARTKMDKVAKAEGLSRSTYGEHLRKAMLQLVENSYPMLKLYEKGPKQVRGED